MNDHQRLNLFANTRDLSILQAVYENQVGKLKEWLDRQYPGADVEKAINYAFMDAADDPQRFKKGLPYLWSQAAKHALRQLSLEAA